MQLEYAEDTGLGVRISCLVLGFCMSDGDRCGRLPSLLQAGCGVDSAVSRQLLEESLFEESLGPTAAPDFQ